MELIKLSQFVIRAMHSDNPLVKRAAQDVGSLMLQANQDEKMVDGHLEQDINKDNDNEEDQMFNKIMPELLEPSEHDSSPFGSLDTEAPRKTNLPKCANVTLLDLMRQNYGKDHNRRKASS